MIGGGPAASAVGRLLATWGHSVRILSRPADRARGLAESLPPSTRKLLDTIGVLTDVERAGFYRSTGNTVWWGSHDRRVEMFDAGRTCGYQVFRPDLDAVLLTSAAAAGADVQSRAIVRSVTFAGDERASVTYEDAGGQTTATCRVVLDCSGRAGVVARQYRRAHEAERMYAVVGVWQQQRGWNLPDETHTLVETYDDGWAWSVPISRSTRHVGTMIDPTFHAETAEHAETTLQVRRVLRGRLRRSGGARALADAYRSEIGRTRQLDALVRDATLQHVFACDASSYSSMVCAGPQFLLVGDAASFIDPLSSFGVKKALASAWLAAIVVHTALIDPDRRAAALGFFSQWERHAYLTHARQSREFARAAFAHHPHPFWAMRAERQIDPPVEVDEDDLVRDPGVQAAFDQLKQRPAVDFVLADGVRLARRPVIRGREIVLEDTFVASASPGAKSRREQSSKGEASAEAASRTSPGLRFVGHVDLVKLADLACRHRQVPEIFEAYCRTCADVPLPSVLGGLSYLLAKGILKQRV